MSLDSWKTIAEIASYCIGIVAVVVAVGTYRANSRRERAKWAIQLYEKFYESDHYRTMRDNFDCSADGQAVRDIIESEDSAFTDYLNFFETVAFLVTRKQLSKDDVLSLFHYYLRCLKRHRSVMNYLNEREKGFEHLNEFLNKVEL
ncbi:MAG TPA: hypothetical protein VLZ50_03335 [Terracidiphilus sp.]|nr:hypothetical protein [Terracidiphilus sp.]